MKKTSIFLLLFALVVLSKAQTPIGGTINPSLTRTVQRNFTGFNSAQGYLEKAYNYYNPSAGLEVIPIFSDVFNTLGSNTYWRFPGGTTSNFYNRWYSGFGGGGTSQLYGDDITFLPPTYLNLTARNSLYSSYNSYITAGYPNSSSNIIFPFINSITNNLTKNNKSVFCINVINHYRNVASSGSIYDTRKETLIDTNKIKAINNLDNFTNSTLSSEFKRIVKQNLSAYLTLVSNNLEVYNVEIGNETFTYMYDDNIFTDYNNFVYNSHPLFNADKTLWYRDNGSAASINDSYKSLWSFAHLARMYRVLITDTLLKLSTSNINYLNHYNNIKFGIAQPSFLAGGFSRYSQFFATTQVKNYINNSAYIVHPYLDQNNFIKQPLTSKTNTNITNLNTEFTKLRDTLEISYNQRFFKKNLIGDINNYPINSEFWVTEWNFLFDWDNLKKVGNTMLHAMYYYDVMMDFMDINANKNLQVSCNKTNPIKLCTYQIPYCGSSDETWYNMIRFSNGYNTNYIDSKTTINAVLNDVKYNSTYYAHQLLLPILNDTSIRYVDVVNGGFTTMPNCSFRTFTKPAGTKDCSRMCVYIYFNNKSGVDYTIAVKSALTTYMNDNDLDCVTNASKYYLYANNLYASMGKTTFRISDFLTTNPDLTIQRIDDEVVTSSDIDNILIPKYSVGYIKVYVSSYLCCPSELRIANTNFKTKSDKQNAYPNPTKGILNFEFLDETSKHIEILDINGRIVNVLNTNKNIISIDLSNNAKGVYYYKITNENGTKVSKFILD